MNWTGSDGHVQSSFWYVLPESLHLDVEMTVQPERRKLGIYAVPVYVAKVHATGQFDLAPAMQRRSASDDTVRLHLDKSHLLIPVQDLRGVRRLEDAVTPVTQGRFEPGSGFPLPTLSAPVRADLNLAGGKQAFDITFEVAGTQSLAFEPLARVSQVDLRGNWPDPGFAKGVLPLERHLRNGQFDANWRSLDLNRSFASDWVQGTVAMEALQQEQFGVDLVQPVDLYQQVERATKYAAVFICLSFLTLFIWEHLARRAVHPIQYGLMGLALSAFFLLLLALAEHVGFGAAYVIAALALCSLLGVYLAGAMSSSQSGATASGYFAVLYGFMYLLVTSDDYSLLAGALGLFAILAVAMVLTRKIDWYQAA
ncbi:MAG: inner membrane CreD family protein [Proteobacteria bacterium]|nr:inner membrane CreD family protein [Pseudomonadota bacterium]